MELPEKQGLKLPGRDGTFVFPYKVAVELPEKQGLKLSMGLNNPLLEKCCSGTSRKTRIETQPRYNVYIGEEKVAVELPEKQGLKLFSLVTCYTYNLCCSGTSRKTRIETIIPGISNVNSQKLQWNFQKNKD